ncbi:MAG: hypothetical protein ACWGHO_02645 [Candidatus Moraniibacteriota bacterium]
MNLGFPSRFLKKLDIYQQIRNGQGLSKYKNLWKYEAAFLEVAYGSGHQFLNACPTKEMIIEWIKSIYPEYDGNVDDEIIGNLTWRGYIKKVNDGKEFNVTSEGLLVGEVLSEIENKKYLLVCWNKYRYNLVIDIFWLLIFLGVVNIFFSEKLSDFLKMMRNISIPICNLDFGHNFFVAFLIFVFWPYLNWLYREIYLAIEK